MIHKSFQFLKKLSRIAIHNPRDLKHIMGIANWAAGEIENPISDTRSFESINLLNINPGTQRYELQAFPSVGASITPMESMALAVLSRRIGAKRIFEFGTYKGVSTTQPPLD